MSEEWVSLHTHTEFSILDGASQIPELVDRAVELGMPALGISDHGNLFGAYKFFKECRARGIKPIIGMEAYMAPESRHHKKPVYWGAKEQRKDDVSRGAYTHMLLIAMDSDGLRNLYKLHNLAYTEGFYHKPRIDFNLLQQYGGGIIGTTGCAGGGIPTLLRLGQNTLISLQIEWLRDALDDRLYIEIMDHGTDFDKELNAGLVSMSRSFSIPLLATNDSHYTREEEAHNHEALLALQTRSRLADEKRFRFQGGGYHLRSFDEMAALPLPREALEETVRVAGRVGDYDDVFKPRGYAPRWEGDGEARFDELVARGRNERYSPDRVDVDERLDFETSVIGKMGFKNYFAVLHDVVAWSKSRGIMCGPGRGSAGGSCCAYVLHITDVDPLLYGLLFERFINPERVSPPDIDLDFQDDRRGEIFAYAQEKYGFEHVAHPVTFGIIKAKAGLRDAARVLGYEYAVGDRLSRMVPEQVLGRDHPLTGLDDIRKENPEVYDLALWLEGRVRNVSVHAAGLIISPVSLMDSAPIHTGAKPDEEGVAKDGLLVTGFPMAEMEELGWLKYDILGLKNLTVISNVLRMINETSTR